VITSKQHRESIFTNFHRLQLLLPHSIANGNKKTHFNITGSHNVSTLPFSCLTNQPFWQPYLHYYEVFLR